MLFFERDGALGEKLVEREQSVLKPLLVSNKAGKGGSKDGPPNNNESSCVSYDIRTARGMVDTPHKKLKTFASSAFFSFFCPHRREGGWLFS